MRLLLMPLQMFRAVDSTRLSGIQAFLLLFLCCSWVSVAVQASDSPQAPTAGSTAQPHTTTAPVTSFKTQQSVSSSVPNKEKRSQEDIMFGNQQNKPAGGMVDEMLQSNSDAPAKWTRNSTLKQFATGPQSALSTGPLGEEDTGPQMLAFGPGADEQAQPELPDRLDTIPDRLDYYDYVQTDASSEPVQGAVAEEDDLGSEGDEQEEQELEPAAERPQIFGTHRSAEPFGSHRQMGAPTPFGHGQMNQYAPAEDFEEFQGGAPSSLLYRRRKRGTLLRSPLEDLMSPGSVVGSTFRRRRASSSPIMRLKRDAASNELRTWLALLHRNEQPLGLPRNRIPITEMDIQELEDPDIDTLPLSGMIPASAYLLDNAGDEDESEDQEVLPASLLESLALQAEEDLPRTTDDWELRGPARRRSSAGSFYPVDYRYVILPGARKRSNSPAIFGTVGGHFGGTPEGNRWSREPQPARWGNFPLRHPYQQHPFQQHQQYTQGAVVRRRAPHPPQENDVERLYALASLLATPGAAGDDGEEDRRRRRRSPVSSTLTG